MKHKYWINVLLLARKKITAGINTSELISIPCLYFKAKSRTSIGGLDTPVKISIIRYSPTSSSAKRSYLLFAGASGKNVWSSSNDIYSYDNILVSFDDLLNNKGD